MLIAVDDDAEGLRDVERELSDRYGRHYQVVCVRSPLEAHERLEEFAASGDDVALVLAAQWLPGMTGSELLDEARRLHPNAKRGLLVGWGEWGDPATGEAIFDAIAKGRIDHYVLRPSAPPDELFHHAISGMLLDWADAQRTSPHAVFVVGESWSGRAFELREALGRCAMPHTFQPRRFARRPGTGRAGGRRGDVAARRLPRRHHPEGPHQRRAGAGVPDRR